MLSTFRCMVIWYVFSLLLFSAWQCIQSLFSVRVWLAQRRWYRNFAIHLCHASRLKFLQRYFSRLVFCLLKNVWASFTGNRQWCKRSELHRDPSPKWKKTKQQQQQTKQNKILKEKKEKKRKQNDVLVFNFIHNYFDSKDDKHNSNESSNNRTSSIQKWTGSHRYKH